LKKRITKFLTILAVLFFSLQSAICQPYNIDYYGIVSSEIDDNMAKMLSDLYYTQFQEISSFYVTDKRTQDCLKTIPSNDSIDSSNFSFYSIITKENAKWISNLTIKNKNLNHSVKKEFDSFYKILMEPKDIVQASLKDLVLQKTVTSTEKESEQPQINLPQISTEFLSGTWYGENNIDKIVIMRGGRGFVIFNNGASMNISVELSNASKKTIKIKQNGRSNASFYPDLPRQVALKVAVNANPIEWNFELLDDNTLKGKKSTLIFANEDAIPGIIDVTWHRRS
jgi:hypothetical protein